MDTLSGRIPELTDTPRPGEPFPTLPGDVAFAYEWWAAVPFGATKTIAFATKRFALNRPPDAVPERGCLLLLGVGGASLLARRRPR